MVKWSKLSKARVFRGQEKKIDNKILHCPGLYPQFFFCLRRHFSFFALQKRVRWKLDFYTVLKFFCLRRHLYYFLLRKKRSATPHRSSAEALVPRVIEPQRALHWHARGYREGACMQVQNHCPIQIIFPTSLGIPLHFAAKNATRPKQKVPRECSAPGFGTLFEFRGAVKVGPESQF